jgi:hypothetical protein
MTRRSRLSQSRVRKCSPQSCLPPIAEGGFGRPLAFRRVLLLGVSVLSAECANPARARLAKHPAADASPNSGNFGWRSIYRERHGSNGLLTTKQQREMTPGVFAGPQAEAGGNERVFDRAKAGDGDGVLQAERGGWVTWDSPHAYWSLRPLGGGPSPCASGWLAQCELRDQECAAHGTRATDSAELPRDGPGGFSARMATGHPTRHPSDSPRPRPDGLKSRSLLVPLLERRRDGGRLEDAQARSDQND